MPRRSRRPIALAAATATLLGAASLVAAEPAFAQYPPPPSLEIEDITLVPGQDDVDFTGTGYQPGELALARLVPVGGNGAGGAPNAASARGAAAYPGALEARPSSKPSPSPSPTSTSDGGGGREIVNFDYFPADEEGTVVGAVTIPEDIKPGLYDFQLVGQESGLSQSVRVSIARADDDHDHDDNGDEDHGDEDHGRPGNGDDNGDHGRPGNGDDHGDDHDWSDRGGDHGDKGDDHDDNGDKGDDHDDDGDDNGSKSDDDDDSAKLADTGSSDTSVALLSAAGGLLLLGGGSLVLVKRRRKSAAQRG
ncbi:LPXTG cell wall anchor domain-containing protein [Streptomyces sp. NPDC007861]|uniref:LPXTG cell wall anchor domain-containing protein n=1 Tax=Streptomyces sp. NPDC007861 TaxID=3154893 RepID=UPI0033EC0073